MSNQAAINNGSSSQIPMPPPATCMESVNRIAKLPVVEQTLQTAHGIYEKVKDYNNVTNWTLETAENTVHKAVEIGKPYAVPVIKNLEGPIKKVDDVLCSGLDYVETKVPAVKLPPQEIYNSTKGLVTPAVESAKSYAEPVIKTAKDIIEPVVENVKEKVDTYLHKSHEYTQSSATANQQPTASATAQQPEKKQFQNGEQKQATNLDQSTDESQDKSN